MTGGTGLYCQVELLHFILYQLWYRINCFDDASEKCILYTCKFTKDINFEDFYDLMIKQRKSLPSGKYKSSKTFYTYSMFLLFYLQQQKSVISVMTPRWCNCSSTCRQLYQLSCCTSQQSLGLMVCAVGLKANNAS